MDGILLIDKESGITSYDVIRRLKRKLPKKIKIGHAGTLDPFATGLLIILLGRATKLVNKIHEEKKGYWVKAEFGYETDTQDVTGTKINVSEEIPTVDNEALKKALLHFIGEIEQIPPRFSAVKIDGKRAYDLAREGKEFEIKPKQVTVHSFDILKNEWPIVEFEMVVSTGTYVRTLITDLARAVGTFGTAIELRRSFIGEYLVDGALKSNEIESADFEKNQFLIPLK